MRRKGASSSGGRGRGRFPILTFVPDNAIGQRLQRIQVALLKSMGPGRKNLKDPKQPVALNERQNHNRPDSQSSTGLGVNPKIRLGVVALLQAAGLYARAREPVTGIEAYSDIGSVRAGGGVADNLFSPHQGNRGPGGAGGQTGFRQFVLQAEFFSGVAGQVRQLA